MSGYVYHCCYINLIERQKCNNKVLNENQSMFINILTKDAVCRYQQNNGKHRPHKVPHFSGRLVIFILLPFIRSSTRYPTITASSHRPEVITYRRTLTLWGVRILKKRKENLLNKSIVFFFFPYFKRWASFRKSVEIA